MMVICVHDKGIKMDKVSNLLVCMSNMTSEWMNVNFGVEVIWLLDILLHKYPFGHGKEERIIWRLLAMWMSSHLHAGLSVNLHLCRG